MPRFLRRRRRPVQNGVNAIFSGKTSSGAALNHQDGNLTGISARLKGIHARVSVSRILSTMCLIAMGVTLIGGSFLFDLPSQQVPGTNGPAPTSPIKTVSRIAPGFRALTNIGEMIVENGGSYGGTIGTDSGDLLVVQIAYSEGGSGNLPDLSRVSDTLSSVYNRVGNASPGVEANFWEQVWTARSLASSSATNVTVNPDWTGCMLPCVRSIIISMSVARYRDVGDVGTSIDIAPNVSSAFQTAGITVDRSESVLVELLSHGAYNDCGRDAATPQSGQTFRNCYTGTTERTELFDHAVTRAQSYSESYVWSQLEVQRGIYLELYGRVVT